MSLTSDVLVRVSVEYLKALDHLVLVVFRRAVTHVVEHLVPDLLTLVGSQLEYSLPEVRMVPTYTTRTHLLGRLEPHSVILALC